LAGVAAFVVVASVLTGPTLAARPVCSSGASGAIVGGRHVCLRVGLSCKSKFQAVYRKHGFVCRSGRLQRLPKPKPLVTTPKLPAAQPLPAGTATLTLPTPTSDWGQGGGKLALTDSAVWVSSGLWRIDPATNAVSAPLTTPDRSAYMNTGEGSVWASDFGYDLVRRYDAATGQLLAVIQLPAGSAPTGITDANGAIWVANHHGGTVSRIDPATNKVVANIKVATPGASGGPQGIAAGLGSVWVGVSNANSVVRIDPATNAIQAVIPMPGNVALPCGGIAIGQTAVWITSCDDLPLIARIDATHNQVTSILNVGFVLDPVADGDTVWFVTGGVPGQPPHSASLIHLGADDSVNARYALATGFTSGGTALAFGSLWLSDSSKPLVLRIPNPR
jgi:YVTN family beta-propeller protein